MPVCFLQILVLEESSCREHDIGIVGRVGEELFVHYGEQIRTHEAADHFIVIRAHRRWIRVVDKQRLDWGIVHRV